MARYISFAVLLAIIVVIGALFYKVMIGFFVLSGILLCIYATSFAANEMFY